MGSGMRPLLVGVSLKLHTGPARSASGAAALRTIVERHGALRSGRVELFVLPAPVALVAVRDALAIGAQDLF